jgi:microcystin-dependent protein
VTDTPLEQLPSEAVSTSVEQLADAISAADTGPAVVVRVGVVTAVEVTGSRRVQCDIGGSTWLSRLQDVALAVGDRVSVLQQDAVMLIIGRLSGVDVAAPIGIVLPFAGSSTAIPAGWLLANGAAVSRTTYAALFAVIGTTYGTGNGSTTFNLPNMPDRMPVGSGSTYARGATGGLAAVTLTTSSLPSHSHTLSGSADSAGSHSHSLSGSTGSDGDHSHSVDNQGGRSDLLAGGGTSAATSGGGSTGGGGGHSHGLSGTASSAGGHSHSLSGSVSSTGSGGSHENMPPYLAMPYIVRAL